jgi:hypothetical protein
MVASESLIHFPLLLERLWTHNQKSFLRIQRPSFRKVFLFFYSAGFLSGEKGGAAAIKNNFFNPLNPFFI